MEVQSHFTNLPPEPTDPSIVTTMSLASAARIKGDFTKPINSTFQTHKRRDYFLSALIFASNHNKVKRQLFVEFFLMVRLYPLRQSVI
jgi:hypothetical protein